MTTGKILQELQAMGNPATKRIYQNHGAREPLFGVKIADLQNLVKKIKKNQGLALDLYDTGNSDAMYLAALIAEPEKMTIEILGCWVQKADWYMLSEYAVAPLAAKTAFGWELGLAWILAQQDHVQAAGWTTLSGVVLKKHANVRDPERLYDLLDHVKKSIHEAPNRSRYAMNGFLISVGGSVPELTDKATTIARAIGTIKVDMGGTACQVPNAPDMIEKT